MMGKDSRTEPGRPLAAQLLREVAREALQACDPAAAVRRAVHVRPEQLSLCGRPISLKRQGRLLVLAFGTGAPAMPAGFLRRFSEAGGRRGVDVLVVHPVTAPEGRGRRSGTQAPPPILQEELAALRLPAARMHLRTMAAEHPIPQKGSFAAAQAALRFAARAGTGEDLIILASGGGSSLMAAPLPGLMKEADKTALHRVLLTSGAPISTINAVRKHLSGVKGGRLAVAARRAATQSTLVMCDVDPERFDEVASGPSLPDRTTLDDMIR